MKRSLAILTVLCLCFTVLTSCKGTGRALTVNGEKIDQAEYAFFLNYSKISTGKDGYTADELENARQEAIDRIVINQVVRQKCKKLGIKLSKSEIKQLEQEKNAFIKALGGKAKYLEYLKAACMTDRLYDKLAENELYYNKIQDYIEEQSQEVLTDQKLRQFFAENYICVKYIRLSITAENGEPMTDHGMAVVKEQAVNVLSKSKDPNISFDELILKYSDDVGIEGGVEGLIVSVLDAKGEPYMQTAFNIADNETALCLQSDGYYIVKRLPVDASYFEENRSYIHNTALDFRFMETIQQWCENAEVKVHNAVDKITFKNIEKYIR